MEKGFFNQEDVNALSKMKSLVDAKEYVYATLDEFIAKHPQVHAANVRKVRAFTEKSKTVIQLMTSVQNFILAHPSEGLGVIK